MKCFQIYEEDLAALEHTLPQILDELYPTMDAKLRVQWRRVREIVCNVRWNYGPPLKVETIPADGETEPEA